MTETTPSQLLRACDLPQAWRSHNAWRILDTGFNGLRFLHCAQAWQQDSRRARTLHYVALSAQAPDPQAWLATADPAAGQLASDLARQCVGLVPGFHRIVLHEGRLLLTLCIGETRAMLQEQQFEADSVFLDLTTGASWDRWQVKALARCCRRGSRLGATEVLPAELQAHLSQQGFEPGADHASFNPHWPARASRQPLRTVATVPTRCVVVGAGLAGASVAAALANRGWQVEVFDSAPAPAAGASGLPVGLVVPHVSADDSPRSRLSRAGVRLMLQQLRASLQPGQDWQASGVLELRLDGKLGLPQDWSPAAEQWSRSVPPDAAAHWQAGLPPELPRLWHAQAAWVKPARLVQAWLARPGVRFHGDSHVSRLRRVADQWQLLDAQGGLLGSAPILILANACEALRLLQALDPAMAALQRSLTRLPALHGMRGVLTWGLQPTDAASGPAPALPPCPVNGLGSLIPSVPTPDGLAWYAGATYEAQEQASLRGADHHRLNRDKLERLLPAAGRVLAPCFDAAQVQAWGNLRCVSADRLPLAGPLEESDQPSLWLSSAMGSRGLSFAVLCAELLAARLGAEPWPVESSLARHLHALRRTTPPVENA